MTPEQAETGRIGVELMTAWSAGDEDHGLYRERLQVLLGESRRAGAWPLDPDACHTLSGPLCAAGQRLLKATVL
jgi:hypothetical protein